LSHSPTQARTINTPVRLWYPLPSTLCTCPPSRPDRRRPRSAFRWTPRIRGPPGWGGSAFRGRQRRRLDPRIHSQNSCVLCVNHYLGDAVESFPHANPHSQHTRSSLSSPSQHALHLSSQSSWPPSSWIGIPVDTSTSGPSGLVRYNVPRGVSAGGWTRGSRSDGAVPSHS
jgi:hypothetical protein